MSAVSKAYFFFVSERQGAKQKFDNTFLFSKVLTAQTVVLLYDTQQAAFASLPQTVNSNVLCYFINN